MRKQEFEGGTWIDPEEVCYPSGGMLRRGRARCADGKVRAFRAGIPDTYFTIPASMRVSGKYVRGYLTIDTKTDDHGTIVFNVPARPEGGAA